MADDAKVEAAKATDAKKIRLRFTQPHRHVGTDGKSKTYQRGDEDAFGQADADFIRAQGSAQTVIGA
ncbi:MAG: hypothetical protein IJH04_01395 [Eggerthellaceae bacterium]|nr:hypothetical protein [Eggerthellaceae bacterium]